MFDLHVWVWCIIYGKIYRYTYTYYYYIYIYTIYIYIYINNIDILSSYDHIWSRKLCLLAGSVCFLAMARLQWPKKNDLARQLCLGQGKI